MVQDSADVLKYPIPNDGTLEPPAEWSELRGKCPVAHVTFPSGDAARLLTRYDDVKGLLADPRFGRGTGKDAASVTEGDHDPLNNSEMAMAIPQEGEGHLTWRRQLNKWFTAKQMARLRPRITEVAEHLVDEMTAKGAPADLKADLGFPLPVWVICEILGVPDSDRDKFSYWSDTLLNMSRYDGEEIRAAQTEFYKYLAVHVAAKRADPGDDLLSELANDPEATMSDATLIATGQGLLVAGHETTANMIGKMIAMLLADRRRWEALLADPKLARSAVEEALRMDVNAGFGMIRYIDQEIAIAGETIVPGTTVVCSMAAANRDEAAFANASEMDLSRIPNPHLAFGAGLHSCLGQSLARTELQVTLEVLLRKLPTLELAVSEGGLEKVEGLLVGGLVAVPVKW